MIKTAIFGAGQAGRMVSKWLPSTNKLICYIDNNKDKQGTDIDGVRIASLAEALENGLDRIWIATLNTDAAASYRPARVCCTRQRIDYEDNSMQARKA